jgi:predicted DNA-binding transcriptional regulator AlpA
VPNPVTAGDRKPDAYQPPDPLLTAREVAAERRQSLTGFWRDVRAGRVPAAIRVTPRNPRWRRSEILAGLEALRGSPAPQHTSSES